KHQVEQLPLVDEAGRLAGLITVKAFVKTEQYPRATKDGDGRLRVAAAVGFFGDAWQRATSLVEAGVDVLVPDTANGQARLMLDMVRRLKADPAMRHVQVLAGNVASRGYARSLTPTTRFGESKLGWREIGAAGRAVATVPRRIAFELPEHITIDLHDFAVRPSRLGRYHTDIKDSEDLGFLFGTFL